MQNICYVHKFNANVMCRYITCNAYVIRMHLVCEDMITLMGETVKISYSRTFNTMGRAEFFASQTRSPEIVELTLEKYAKDNI